MLQEQPPTELEDAHSPRGPGQTVVLQRRGRLGFVQGQAGTGVVNQTYFWRLHPHWGKMLWPQILGIQSLGPVASLRWLKDPEVGHFSGSDPRTVLS